MTLGSFAVAAGASRKWVQNAQALLQLQPEYTPERAKLFALIRALEDGFDLPLGRAYALASHTLAAPDDPDRWRHRSHDGIATIQIDRDRFLSSFAARLSLAREGYAERRRGRPAARTRRGGVAAAREHGIDIDLLEESLRRTPAERLRRLDDDVAFVQSLRVAEQ